MGIKKVQKWAKMKGGKKKKNEQTYVTCPLSNLKLAK